MSVGKHIGKDTTLMEDFEKLVALLEALRTENRQLKSLLGRIHKATDQFYCKKPDKVDDCPYEAIMGLWKKIMWKFPKVRILTSKRKVAMRARWKVDLTTLGDWEAYFLDVSKKEFLHGKNARGWVGDIDFFLREDTVAKCQEGKYDGI